MKHAPIIGRLSAISSALLTNSSPNSALSEAHSYGRDTLVDSVSAVVESPAALRSGMGGHRAAIRRQAE